MILRGKKPERRGGCLPEGLLVRRDGKHEEEADDEKNNDCAHPEALTARQVGDPAHEQRIEQGSILFPSSVSTNLLLYLGDKSA